MENKRKEHDDDKDQAGVTERGLEKSRREGGWQRYRKEKKTTKPPSLLHASGLDQAELGGVKFQFKWETDGFNMQLVPAFVRTRQDFINTQEWPEKDMDLVKGIILVVIIEKKIIL